MRQSIKIIKKISLLLFWFYIIIINVTLVFNILKGDYLKGIIVSISLILLYIVNVFFLGGLNNYLKKEK